MPSFSFDPALVLRVPSRPFQTPPVTLSDFIEKVLPDTFFQEAVYIASPSLHRAMMACLNGTETNPDKQQRTLLAALNYHTRMTTRSTPFGLFAGCSVAQWSTGALADGPIGIVESQRYIRLDVRYLHQLSAYIGSLPAIRPRLTYRSNSSLYEAGDALRYVEMVPANGNGSPAWQVSAVDRSEYIHVVLTLSRNGCPHADLLTGLMALDVLPDEAIAFIDDLIECQLLQSDLHPTVTGHDVLHRLHETVASAYLATADPELEPVLNTLTAVQSQLKSLNDRAINDIRCYQQLIDTLAVLPIPVSENYLTHTDLFYSLQPATLPHNWQKELLQAFSLLNQLTVRQGNGQLTDFKNRFLARYDQQEIPLLTALDAEMGVGYGTQAYSGASSLIAGLSEPDPPFTSPMPPNQPVPDWCHNPDFWLRVLQTAAQTQARSVAITDADLATLPPVDTSDLPPSLSVVFRIVTDPDGTRRVMPEGFSGSSSVNLPGRFGTGNEAICALTNRLAMLEQTTNPGVIFAEVIHLPPESVANVLRHPPIRAYEIPYLTNSSLPPAQQIPVQDLLISVKNGQIVLRSARLNRLIIPRLSNAHNYRHKALPVYGFLADLQRQGLHTTLAFSWGNLAKYYSFFPRITYGNCLISPATWAVFADELTPLSPKTGLPSETATRAFRTQRGLPRYTLLADGDHELLTDWESPLSVAGLLSVVRQERILLREFWPEEPGQAVVQTPTGQPIPHQFIGSLIKSEATYANRPAPATGAETGIQRSFPVGSEWLYVKLYTGLQTTDQLLTDVVHPLVATLMSNGTIDNWFFLRYADPAHHLRLRLHLTNPQQTGVVLEAIRIHTQPLTGQGIIEQVIYAPYVRELERYGPGTIALSERLFGYDSAAVLDMLRLLPDEDRDPLRWLWTMRAIDQLLDAFGLALPNKHRLLIEFRDAFSREFSVDTPLKKKMDQRYRTYRSQVELWLAGPDQAGPLSAWPALQQRLQDRYTQLCQLAVSLQSTDHQPVALSSLLSSYVHLLVNRAIASDQRFHELLIYDFMSRQYQSVLARQSKAGS